VLKHCNWERTQESEGNEGTVITISGTDAMDILYSKENNTMMVFFFLIFYLFFFL
jgi:hypothetical protein